MSTTALPLQRVAPPIASPYRGRLSVERLADEDSLPACAREWNELAAGNPFRSWHWLVTWWHTYAGTRTLSPLRNELYVLCVRDDSGTLVGLTPWYLDVSPRRRVVRFLGSGEVCTDYLGILCQPGYESAVAEVLAEWLIDAVRRRPRLGALGQSDRWDRIELGALDADDVATRELLDRLSAHGAIVDRRPGPNCWRLSLPEDWDDYLATLSKSHRKQVRRCERRIFDPGRAQLFTVENEEQFEQGWQVLVDLHQRRWNHAGRPGCFASQQFADFHRTVARVMLEQDRLRLHWLELDGRPIAAEYHLAGRDVIYAYQSGVDPGAYEAEPGRLATMATLHKAVDDGFAAFDWLRGDEPYKAHWRGEPRPTHDVRVLPGGFGARVQAARWSAAEVLRRWRGSIVRRTS